MNIWINKATNGQFYCTLETTGNHKVLATSETYHNKSDCRAAAELVKGEAGGASIIDIA